MKKAVVPPGLLLVAAVLGLLWSADVASASHAIRPAYLWADLQPGGDRHLKYDLCSGGDPNEAHWQQGVENADASIAGWEFDPAACGSFPSQITLAWESPPIECPAGAKACWEPLAYYDSGNGYRQLTFARILFDRVNYTAYNISWRTSISAHEWGHNLSLDDHQVARCSPGLNTLMGFSPEPPPAGNACFEGPSPPDLSSVRCNVYGYCGDFSGDTCADILARRTDNGTLRLYRGNCDGTIDGTSGGVIGSGWNVFNWLLRPGDLDPDLDPGELNSGGCTDIIARKPSGTLWHYVGTCDGGYEGVAPQIGNGGWQAFNWLVGPGDFNGDGCADVLARKLSGVLSLYHGDCDGGFPVSADIGPGWNVFNWMVGPGDFDGDGCPDLITRRADNGTLRLYNGNCQGGFAQGAGGVIGTGWNVFNSIVGPGDFSGDGCPDLITRRTDNGTLRLYRGDCFGGIDGTSGGVIGSGWNVFNWLF